MVKYAIITAMTTLVKNVEEGEKVKMNEKFLKLTPEKQKIIMQAICEEFTEHTYNDASTNRIMEKAGISKGTLFNYFGCKEKMYHAAINHAIDFFKENEIHEFETGDFIERCRILAELDMRIYRDVPYMMNFLASMYVGDQTHMPATITELFGTGLTEALERLYKDVDYSLFRSDVDPTILMKMIRYTFDGYMKDIVEQIRVGKLSAETFEMFIDDYDVFLKELRKICYTQEFPFTQEVTQDVGEV